MLQSMSVQKLLPALLEAQKGFPKIVKASDNPYFKSKYAELPDILEAVNPVLHKNGLLVIQGTDDTTEGHIKVVTTIYHESGEYISSSLDLKLAKDDPQGAGSGITYARRYGVCLALNIAPDKDDDGNAASGKSEEKTQAAAKAPAIKKITKEQAIADIKSAPDRETVIKINGMLKKVAQQLSKTDIEEVIKVRDAKLQELAGTGQNQ